MPTQTFSSFDAFFEANRHASLRAMLLGTDRGSWVLIQRAAKGDKPFFTYVALSHIHPPEKAHPDFDQTDPTRLGIYADLIAEMDHRVG